MDRYWNEEGQPFLFQDEQILLTAPGVTPRVVSGLNIKLKDLKKGTLYVSNLRLIFICQMKKKAKDPRLMYDGFSLFYSDVNSASLVGKGSLKIEAVLEKGTLKSKKANIYFKDIPKDIQNEAVIRIEESLKDRGIPTVIDEPVYEEPKKEAIEKKVPPPESRVSDSVQYLLSDIDEDVIELTCPSCGSLVNYRPGMYICPACKKNVKFIAD
ncbi:MAG: hypothetical protein HWN66_01595 [Candidatus Helarchaeota archaeon]|nr:hypothetical protein [Candidatus Helarchaeota archaeon]